MPEVIISDTSCFIVLTNINALDLLHKVYGNIITTQEVATEFGEQLPSWVILREVTNRRYQALLQMQVDNGEASAIALAIEYNDCLLIVDDIRARKVAANLGLTITGTIGVIARAKLKGIIPSVKPYLDKIRSTNFRLSEDLYRLILKEVGEE